MERNDTDAELSPESNTEVPVARTGDEATAPPPPLNITSGALGAVVAIAVSALLVLALWTIARDAPSAATDPRLIPPPTAVPSPGRVGDQLYITIVPTESLAGVAPQGAQSP